MLMTTISTPIGVFHAWADDRGLCRLLFPDVPEPKNPGQARRIPYTEHHVLNLAAKQLNEYLLKIRRVFNLPLSIQGTDFQRSVWDLLCEIPYGQTSSYGELAEKLGSKKKARAVGGAAHINPLPIIIPCHRLIGAGGALTGFAGGLSTKKYLLELEEFQG